MIQDEKGEKR